MNNVFKLLLILAIFLLIPVPCLFSETRINSAEIDRATAEVDRSMRDEAEKHLLLFPEYEEAAKKGEKTDMENKYIRWEDIGKDWIPVNTGTEKDEKE